MSMEEPPSGVHLRRLLKDPPQGWCFMSPPWAVVALCSQLLGISTMVLSRERECGMSPGSHSQLVCKLAYFIALLSRNLAFPYFQLRGCTKVVISDIQCSQIVENCIPNSYFFVELMSNKQNEEQQCRVGTADSAEAALDCLSTGL